AIGNIRWTQLLPDPQPILLTCDIRSGEVRAGHPTGKSRLLAKLRHPCGAEPTDLDHDGVTDLVIADLGSFEARDHQDGRVMWLRPGAEGQPWEAVELLAGLGRVADVRPADFDGDGDLDLVVAEFGWQKTGSVFWLENLSETASRPKFVRHAVDSRAGGIHLPIVDWNADGKPDFLALMSQGYEEILAWINQGDGTCQRQVISPPQDPAFGSSGIELVDLDADGDLDLLYSNGDTFDSKIAKPYHGLQWLENRGAEGFISHRLADLIGAYRALAVDMDLDGDLDIVAAGFLSGDLVDPPPLDQHDSVILLEQTSSGRFSRRRLLQGSFDFPSIEVADFDGDGRPDIAAGNFQRVIQPNKPRAVIWWTRRL
ncbi:MAG: FG-GAP repeat domain-containing protein, partial [Planctomycetota bacterium]